MLVQELVNFTHTYIPGQLATMHMEEKRIEFIITIAEDGSTVSVDENLDTSETKRKVYLTALVPRSPVPRNSGIHPMLAYDGLHYVAGPDTGNWTDQSAFDKEEGHFQGFKELISKAAGETGDEALLALQRFYNNPDGLEKARQMLAALKATGSENAAFRYQGGLVHLRTAVSDYWRQHYHDKFVERHENAGQGYCMITGEFGPLTETHEKIKGASRIGGQASGVNLMSFDKTAFQSYGWKKNANSPLGVEAANAHVLALNKLLLQNNHLEIPGHAELTPQPTRDDQGGVAFIFWTRHPSEIMPYTIVTQKVEVEDIFKPPTEQEIVSDSSLPYPVRVKALLAAAITGREPDYSLLPEENTFFLLTLAGNGGRLVVKGFQHQSLRRVITNIANWFRDQIIADVFNGGEPCRPKHIRVMFPELVNVRIGDGKRIRWDLVDDKLYDHITIPLLYRALFGQPLTHSLLARALSRFMAEPQRRHNPVKMGLIRMIVNDILKHHPTYKDTLTMDITLDPNEKNIAYICGRLMAVYEQIQYSANQSGSRVGQTVMERYYATATTYPLLAFSNLKKLSVAHLKKLRRDNPGAEYNLKQNLDELYTMLPSSGYPKRFSLEQQGIFAIGYHHQSAWFTQQREEYKKARQQAQEEEQS